MNSSFKENFSFGVSVLFVIFMLFGTLIYADTNGIWHEAEDVRVGTFGSDENDSTSSFTFVNPLLATNKIGATQYCDENLENCFNASNVGTSTVPSMVEGWPDVIVCHQASSNDNIVMYIEGEHTSSGRVRYSPLYGEATGDFRYYVIYDSSGNLFENSGFGGSIDCVSNTWSISELYDNNRAFNLLGGGTSSIATEINLEVNIPQGAVIPFSLSSCPTGWSEFAPAYGRFVRGVDRSGTNIDPDGERAIGDIQNDEFKSHVHYSWQMIYNNAVDGVDSTTTGSYENRGYYRSSSPEGGSETRPDNVALLYCIKDVE